MKKRLLAILFIFCFLFVIEGCSTSLSSEPSAEVASVAPAPESHPAFELRESDRGISSWLPSDQETLSSPKPSFSESETGFSPDEKVLPEDSTFSIHFIDVGQADAALVECDGHYMLIDGGNKADSNVIYSVLKSASVPKLDIVIGSHAHEDHIGGIPGAFNYTTADLTLCPVTSYDSDAFSDFARYAQQNGGGIIVPSVGDTYQLGSAPVEIIGVNAGSDTNNKSIVLKIKYGDTAFLFAGDAERDAEQAILKSSKDVSATVLKVGHHGSDTSTTYPFLRAIMPEYAVISVGNNNYGHPNENTLSRLRDADVEVFRTDLQGDIFLTSDGKIVTISTAHQTESDVYAGVLLVTPSPNSTPTLKPELGKDNPPTSPDIEYIGNVSTKKYHVPSCGSVKQMKESNKFYYTGGREDMISMGYVPCKKCNP